MWLGPMPDLVPMCFRRMVSANPEWSIITGTPTDLMDGLHLQLGGDPSSAQGTYDKARLSDEVEALIVAKYGGVWFDASIIAVSYRHACVL